MQSISGTLDKLTKTLSAGWKMNDGEMTTPLLNNPLEGKPLESQVFPNQSTKESSQQQVLIQNCLHSQKTLRQILAVCFETLDTFGKEPEALANIAKVFIMVLGRFTIEHVEIAFRIYMERNTAMPKPADIVNIIEPPIEPRKFCGAAFIDIKRRWREGQFVSDAEKKYCDDFIAARIKGPEEHRNMIEDSIKQIEQQNSQYWLEQ